MAPISFAVLLTTSVKTSSTRLEVFTLVVNKAIRQRLGQYPACPLSWTAEWAEWDPNPEPSLLAFLQKVHDHDPNLLANRRGYVFETPNDHYFPLPNSFDPNFSKKCGELGFSVTQKKVLIATEQPLMYVLIITLIWGILSVGRMVIPDLHLGPHESPLGHIISHVFFKGQVD